MTDFSPGMRFSGYIDCVVEMINKAKKVMNMLRSSSRTGTYAKHIDAILQTGSKDGVSVNQSMCYIMADINRKIDPDKINLNYALDNEGSLHNVLEDTYLNQHFRVEAISTTVLEPFDSSNYLFFFTKTVHAPGETIFFSIDLAKFLEDSTGEKYGIMHTGGKGIQANPSGADIGPDDIIF